MTLQAVNQWVDAITNILHDDTQHHSHHVDLSVSKIYKITNGGSLDFGGSEFEPAERERLEPKILSEDDDYGWWHLDTGTYIIEYNEGVQSVAQGTMLLQPHKRFLDAGGHHPTSVITEPQETLSMTIHVGAEGLNIKENAHVSQVMVG